MVDPGGVLPAKTWRSLASAIAACRAQLRECEKAQDRVDEEDGHPQSIEDYDAERAWLGGLVADLHRRLLIATGIAGLSTFEAEMEAGFSPHRGALDVTERDAYDPDVRRSPALDYLVSMHRSLSATLEPETGRRLIDGVEHLRRVLASTDLVLGRAGVVPRSENDVRNALFDYLRIAFPSIRREVPVPHVIKTFRADLGIDELGALVEIKFVDGETEVRSETPGVFEDMHGYRGDPRWSTHVALVYSTGPHLGQRELEAEFALADCPVNWIPMVVRGAGGRERSFKGGRRGVREPGAAGTASTSQLAAGRERRSAIVDEPH